MDEIEVVNRIKFSSVEDLIDVVKVQYVMEELTMKVVLRVYNFWVKRYDEVTILRSDMEVNAIRKLMQNLGYPFNNFKQINEHLVNRVNQIALHNVLGNKKCIELAYYTLGWAEYEGSIAFYANKIYTTTGEIDSIYVGDKKIEPNGNLEVFVDMIKTCVCGNTPLEAICAIATAATVLPYANLMWSCKFDNYINHLVETSTTGKSTAIDLFISFGAAPELVKSWRLTFNSTDNALMMQIQQNNGFPCGIDELSSGTRKERSQFVYSLANGVGKSISIAGGSKVREGGEFHTVFVTNGESGLIKQCNKNDGIGVRVFEYGVDAWTRSDKESLKIKSVVRNNHALVTPLIATELLRNSDTWQNCLNTWKDRVRQKMKSDKIVSNLCMRVANAVALYMTSCEIAGTILSVHFDIEKVFEFFYFYIICARAEEEERGMKAYQAVVRHYVRYKNERYGDAVPRMSTLIGKDDDYSICPDKEGFALHSARPHKAKDGTIYNQYVVFYPNVLEKILDDNHSTDAMLDIKAMGKEKLLRVKDANRLYTEIYLEGIKTKVFAVWINDNTFDDCSQDYDSETQFE